MISSFPSLLRAGVCAFALVSAGAIANSAVANDWGKHRNSNVFQRIASYEVFNNLGPGENPTTETSAEIITATKDGKTLIWSNSPAERVEFLDISDPYNPVGDGFIAIDGEPTAVSVAGKYLLVGVNTSPDLVNPSGVLLVIDIASRTVVREIEMMGQPDSVAVSPGGYFAAVAIENERDEDIDVGGVEGGLPQFPAGFLQVLRLKGAPANWTVKKVEMSDLRGCKTAPEDPEPEFVDINGYGLAAVSLQENNCIAVVSLWSGRIIRSFDAGAVDLEHIDTHDQPRPNIIEFIDSQPDRKREPDAIGWIKGGIATANEGDFEGGSRGFTVFSMRGKVRHESGSGLEHIIAAHGQYPDRRSDAKGVEPEGIEVGRFGRDTYLFVGAERANAVGVYKVRNIRRPQFVQLLPTGIGPEGLLAIPKRGLFVVAAEVDEADEVDPRSVITIFKLDKGPAAYPTVVSKTDFKGLPIPWGALSALAADRKDEALLYSGHDSFYQQPRIYKMDVGQQPAVIFDEIPLTGLADPTDFDLEGLVQRSDGSFWIVSEGRGDVADDDVERLNRLYEVAADGTVLSIVDLPNDVNDQQRNNGFEGVAVTGSVGTGEVVYVAFQREWEDDPSGMVRIGRYLPATDSWTFFHYPLDAPTSPNAGWVGLSEIVAVDDETFAVIERDNQYGGNATIKKIYKFFIDGLTPQPQGSVFPVVDKFEVLDLIPALLETNGRVEEKVEGLAIADDGEVYMVTDNDGVNDATGETAFRNLGDAEDLFDDD